MSRMPGARRMTTKDHADIWRFQSAEPAIEFTATEEGWALAWKTFRELENQTAQPGRDELQHSR